MEIQSTSEMSPYFTMTKCNKLFITYLTRSTERLPSLYIQVKKKAFIINAKIEDVGLNKD